MSKKDYYEVLGVTKSASDADLKRAYRKLAQKYHPDKKGGDEKKFKEVNEAYQTLSNKEKRAQYDRFGSGFSGQGAGFSGFNGQGFNGSINIEDLGEFSDIFESFFGGRGRGRTRRTYRRGSDLQVVQEITLEQAYTGVTKELSFTTFGSCKECSGKGHDEKEGTKKCETCDGQGEIQEVRQSFFGAVRQVRTCSKCHGSGNIPNKVCKKCSGAGRVEEKRTQKVEIIPGVTSGQLIKVAGAGEAGERGAAAGDLYVQVLVKKHKTFAREGADLFLKKEVSLLDVLLNKKVSVPTIDEKTIELEIPAGVNLNERIKLSGKGMPYLNRSSHGDLYVELEIKKPKKLSSKAKKLLDELEGEL